MTLIASSKRHSLAAEALDLSVPSSSGVVVAWFRASLSLLLVCFKQVVSNGVRLESCGTPPGGAVPYQKQLPGSRSFSRTASARGMLRVRRTASVQCAVRASPSVRCATPLPRQILPSARFRTAPTVVFAKAEKKDTGTTGLCHTPLTSCRWSEGWSEGW